MSDARYPCTAITAGYIKYARLHFSQWPDFAISMAFRVNPGTVAQILSGKRNLPQEAIPIPPEMLAEISSRVRDSYPCSSETVGFIKEARSRFPEWSVFELALAFLVHPGTISKILKGRRNPEQGPIPIPAGLLTEIVARLGS